MQRAKRFSKMIFESLYWEKGIYYETEFKRISSIRKRTRLYTR